MDEKVKKIKKLTKKEQLFISAYLTHFNGTKAAIKAGYSKKTAAVIAYENLRKPYIKSEIEERTKEILTKEGINQLQVMREVKRIAFFDIRKVYDDKNALMDIKKLDDDSAAAIQAVEVLEEFAGSGEDRIHIGNTVKIKLNSKESALRMLVQYLGLTPERIDITSKGKELKAQTTDRVIKTTLKII